MSDNFYAVYGYHLECSGPRKVLTETGLECPQHHKIHNSCEANFCPKCGMELIPKLSYETLSFSDFEHEFDDTIRLMGGDSEQAVRDMMILVENYTSFNNDNPDNLTYLRATYENVFSQEIDDEVNEDLEVPHILPFSVVEEVLAPTIALLEAYLFDNVELRFGLVTYYA